MQAKATDDQILKAIQDANGIRAVAANKLGLNERSLMMRLKKMKAKGYIIPESTYQPGAVKQDVEKAGFSFTPLPDDDVPIEELIEQRKRKFLHKREHEEASKLIPIKVKLGGAIGLLHFGDPHVDDDGCDIEAIERHTELVNKTEGLFACNVGDSSNNWVGRLARLYADQSTSAAQAWKIVEWFVARCDWLYMIAGNHDLWSGAGDPLRWIAKQNGALYKASEARIALRFPNGMEVRVNARHDHSGSKKYL